MFSCRQVFFFKLSSCQEEQQQPQATESVEKCCFSKFQKTRYVVLDLGRPSGAWCFPAGRCFF